MNTATRAAEAPDIQYHSARNDCHSGGEKGALNRPAALPSRTPTNKTVTVGPVWQPDYVATLRRRATQYDDAAPWDIARWRPGDYRDFVAQSLLHRRAAAV